MKPIAKSRPLLVPASWTTSQLMMRDSALPDVPKLHAIFTACGYVEAWDKTFQAVPGDEIAQLVRQSLASDEENYRLNVTRYVGVTIRRRSSGKLCLDIWLKIMTGV